MGYYINPSDESKESFLENKGITVNLRSFKWGDLPEGYMPVVLIDNGLFTAAGVGYCEQEFEVMKESIIDSRPKIGYVVRIEELLHVCGQDFREYIQGRG